MKACLLLFVLALVPRLAAWIFLGRHLRPVAFEEHDMALNLLQTGQYFYEYLGTPQRSFAYPMYPFLMAGIYPLLFFHAFWIGLLHVTVAALLPTLTFLLGRMLLPERTAWMAGLMVVVHPGLVVYSTVWHQMPWVSAVSLLFFLWLFSGALNSPGRALGLGLWVAFGTLLRSTTLGLIPAALGYAWSRRSRPWITAIFLAAFVTGILPWILRNQAVYGKFVFLGTTSAEAFWRGNHAGATGTALAPDGQAVFWKAAPEFQKAILSGDDLRQYEVFRRAASTWIHENPGEFLKITLKKCVYFLSFTPTTGAIYPAWWKYGYACFYLGMVVLALAGFAAILRNPGTHRREWGAIALFGFTLMAQHALCYVELRHRWAFEPFMSLLAANGLTCLGRWRGSRLRNPRTP